MSSLRNAGAKIVIEDPRGHILRSQQDYWLKSHAHPECVDFSLEEKMKLKTYYNAMALNRKSVNLPQIEDFMIAFGLCENRQQVLGALPKGGFQSFEDFLRHLTNKDTKCKNQLLWIFKSMMQGRLGDEKLSFPLRVSAYRRKMLLDALMAAPGSSDQLRGSRILNGFAQQLQGTRDAGAMYGRPNVGQ